MLRKQYNLSVSTKRFDPNLRFEGDIWILDQEHLHDICQTTLLTITASNIAKIRIRVDWRGFEPSDDKFTVLLIEETGNLFIGAAFFWCLVDLKSIRLIRQENCFVFWSFERHADTIVIISELSAQSLTLEGDLIDKVPIDPPFESKDFDDRIEFNSPVYGKQTLKLKF